jgi:hypothetical protein
MQQQHQDEGASIMSLVESAVVRNHHTTDLFRRRRRHRCDQRVAGLINPLVARSGIGLHRNVFSQLSFRRQTNV